MYLLHKDTVNCSIEQDSLVGLKIQFNLHHTHSILFYFKWNCISPPVAPPPPTPSPRNTFIVCLCLSGTLSAEFSPMTKNTWDKSEVEYKWFYRYPGPRHPLVLGTLSPQVPWVPNEHMSLLLTRRNCCSDYRWELEWASWVIAPTHRETLAPRCCIRTDSHLKVNRLKHTILWPP